MEQLENTLRWSECVERAKAGDNGAMTELYDEFAPAIYRYAVTLKGTPFLRQQF